MCASSDCSPVYDDKEICLVKYVTIIIIKLQKNLKLQFSNCTNTSIRLYTYCHTQCTYQYRHMCRQLSVTYSTFAYTMYLSVQTYVYSCL